MPPLASKARGVLIVLLLAIAPLGTWSAPRHAHATRTRCRRAPAADAWRRDEAAAEAAVAAAPLDGAAWLALATARRQRADLDGALAAVERAHLWRPGDERAWQETAAIHLAAHRAPEAARCLAFLPDTGAATRRLRAELALLQGRSEAAWRAAADALRCAPGDAVVVATAAEAAYKAGRLERARRLYRTVVRLDPWHEVANLRLGSGFAASGGRLVFTSVAERAVFDEASAAWRADDLETALVRFADLTAAAPEEPRFRLGLGLVLRERGWREAAFVPPPDAWPEADGTRPVPGEGALVPGFARLPHWQQAVLRRSLEPWAAHLPALLAAGGRHEILPLAASLVDAPEREDLTDQITFDGRWYAHLRGVGGLHAATGEEKLRAAARHEFDTFAHEFAHQILTYALPETVRAEVHGLWRQAVEGGWCLDDYAASNVDEYFAQGWEAFLATSKRPGVRRTASHTRAELKRLDPALHDLLARLTTPDRAVAPGPVAPPTTPDAPPTPQ